MIVINGKNHWQLTDSATGEPQTKTLAEQIADGWPPPDGTSVLKADKADPSLANKGRLPKTVP